MARALTIGDLKPGNPKQKWGKLKDNVTSCDFLATLNAEGIL